MHFTIYLILVAFIAATVSATSYKVTNSTQDYVLLSQRQLRSEITEAELKINFVHTRGADHVKVFSDQHQLVLQEVERYEQSLVPLQALSLIRKHCVQQYKPLLVTWNRAKTLLANCLAASQKRVSALASTAVAPLESAKTAVNTDLPAAVQHCNNLNANNVTNQEQCILSRVDTYSNTVRLNLKTVDKSLDDSVCSLSDITLDELRCSFSVEKNILTTMGRVTDLIENCIIEKETDCPCDNSNSTSSIAVGVSIRRILLGSDE